MTAPTLDGLDRAMLPLLADGYSAAEAGRRLYLSPSSARARAKALRDAINTVNAGGRGATRTPRQPTADPDQADALNRLVRQYARTYGDTPEITKARRDALNAELAQHEPRSEGAAA